MSTKVRLLETLNPLFRPLGCELVPQRLVYEWQRHPKLDRTHGKGWRLPEGAQAHLTPDNPALQDLRARYAAFNRDVTTPLIWTDDWVKPEEILHFRGDNAYVWQLRGRNMNPMAYALMTYYVKSIDDRRLLETLREDDLFGNFTFEIDGKVVSRDLLDSIMEIYFLDKHLDLFGSGRRTVLDIGAGYGRLAHRVACAVPGVATYLCTDGFPVSTFISDYYARFRGVSNRVHVVPLDEIERRMEQEHVDLAVNIHSFSECRMPAIEWWLSLLEKHAVKHLMVVPNTGHHGGERVWTNDGNDFGALIERHGYELVAKEPKYRDPVVQKYAVNPTYHYLFARR